MLADSHVHLHAYADAAGLLERARAVGVTLVVGVGIDLATSRQTIELARAVPGVVAAVGLHPSRIREPLSAATLDELQMLAEEVAAATTANLLRLIRRTKADVQMAPG